MPFGTLLLVGLAVAAVLYFRRHRSDEARARFLRLAAFGFLAVVTVFLGLFVVGETLADPGGWAALGWIAVWLVPLALLALLARLRPDVAVPVLAAATGVVVLVCVWAAVDRAGWRHLEDDHGPVRTLLVFVLVGALAVLGLARPLEAGVLLLVLGVLPVLLATAGGLRGASLLAAATPALVGGALYLGAALTAGAAPPRPAGRQLTR